MLDLTPKLSKEKFFMISAAEKKLIHLLVDLGAENDLINSICSNMTDNQMEYTRLYIQRLQKKKDTITISDMLKAKVVAINRA